MGSSKVTCGVCNQMIFCVVSPETADEDAVGMCETCALAEHHRKCGAADERAAIVAFIRSPKLELTRELDGDWGPAVEELASRIAAGEHRGST